MIEKKEVKNGLITTNNIAQDDCSDQKKLLLSLFSFVLNIYTSNLFYISSKKTCFKARNRQLEKFSVIKSFPKRKIVGTYNSVTIYYYSYDYYCYKNVVETIIKMIRMTI